MQGASNTLKQVTLPEKYHCVIICILSRAGLGHWTPIEIYRQIPLFWICPAWKLYLCPEAEYKDVVDVPHIIHLCELLPYLCFWHISSAGMQDINDLRENLDERKFEGKKSWDHKPVLKWSPRLRCSSDLPLPLYTIRCKADQMQYTILSLEVYGQKRDSIETS